MLSQSLNPFIKPLRESDPAKQHKLWFEGHRSESHSACQRVHGQDTELQTAFGAVVSLKDPPQKIALGGGTAWNHSVCA